MSAEAFDHYAKNYDRDFTDTSVGKLQRQRVYASLFPLLKESDQVLEINCGTGYDAIQLSRYVARVHATDYSEAMIGIAKERLQQEKCDNVDFSVADIRNFSLSENPDLVFSDFGGLNCISPGDLRAFSNNLAARMTGGSKLFFVLMGKKCLWEDLYYLVKGNLRSFRRRSKKGPQIANVQDGTVEVWYYKARELVQLFSPEFKLFMIYPVAFFLPPSYLNGFFSRHRWLLRCLNRLEKLFGRISFLADYSDHFVVVMERNKK
jgi:SAM-dependent methyltransferase